MNRPVNFNLSSSDESSSRTTDLSLLCLETISNLSTTPERESGPVNPYPEYEPLCPKKVVDAFRHGTEEDQRYYDNVYEAFLVTRNYEHIDYLFNHGIKPYVINTAKQTVIHMLYYNRHWDKLKGPIPIYADGENFTDIFGLSHFHVACCVGDIVAVKKFLQDGTATVNDIFVNDPLEQCSGYTPLHFAVHYGQKTIAEFLISKGANVMATDFKEQQPLHIACLYAPMDFE